MKSFVFDPGKLSHLVRLEEPIELSDNIGTLDVTWTDHGNIWAHIMPNVARSTFKAQQDIEEASHKVIIRYRADVGSTWRLKKGNRVFSIKTVLDPDENERYLICTCSEDGR